MSIDLNNFVEYTPLFSTDDGYQAARRKFKNIITPQQDTTPFNSPIGYNSWGALPSISPVNSCGSGPIRSGGSTSPF